MSLSTRQSSRSASLSARVAVAAIALLGLPEPVALAQTAAQAPAAQTPAAQTPAAPTPAAPTTTGPAQAAPPAAPAPSASGGTDYDCLPTCRSGFVCVMKRCVSACNPSCASGEVCVASGRCVSACNPLCDARQQCTSDGRCVSAAPTSAPAPNATPAPSGEPANEIRYDPGAPPPRDELDRHEDALAERRRTGKRFHDGFYLRLGVGAGYLISSTSSDAASSGESSRNTETSAQGFTIPVEIALGGTPTPGLVLGFGSWGVHVPAANYSQGEGDAATDETAEYGAISMFGPFVDLYPAPRSGFHLQAAPCLALVAPGQSDTLVTDAVSGSGFGAMVGLGYEGWVSDQWGLGVLLRAQFASVTVTDDDGHEYDFWGLLPGLVFTATLH